MVTPNPHWASVSLDFPQSIPFSHSCPLLCAPAPSPRPTRSNPNRAFGSSTTKDRDMNKKLSKIKVLLSNYPPFLDFPPGPARRVLDQVLDSILWNAYQDAGGKGGGITERRSPHGDLVSAMSRAADEIDATDIRVVLRRHLPAALPTAISLHCLRVLCREDDLRHYAPLLRLIVSSLVPAIYAPLDKDEGEHEDEFGGGGGEGAGARAGEEDDQESEFDERRQRRARRYVVCCSTGRSVPTSSACVDRGCFPMFGYLVLGLRITLFSVLSVLCTLYSALLLSCILFLGPVSPAVCSLVSRSAHSRVPLLPPLSRAHHSADLPRTSLDLLPRPFLDLPRPTRPTFIKDHLRFSHVPRTTNFLWRSRKHAGWMPRWCGSALGCFPATWRRCRKQRIGIRPTGPIIRTRGGPVFSMQSQS